MTDIVEELRTTAQEASKFDTRYDTVPLGRWSDLMDNAAGEIERLLRFERYHDERHMTPSDFTKKWGDPDVE